MGADGDGVGRLPDGTPIYLPLTLPGELVQARVVAKHGDGWMGVADPILEESPDRATPPCPHFGPCGGCGLQHWGDGAYAEWKRGLLAEALRRGGYADVEVAALVRTPPAARRRADLAIRRGEGGRGDGGVVVGLHMRGSASVTPIDECHVLHPSLQALLMPLQRLMGGLACLRRRGSAVLNLLDSGPDLLLRTDAAMTPECRTALAGFARQCGVPRIGWAEEGASPGAGTAETACQLRPVAIGLAGVEIVPPPGAFLQASAEGEAAITEAVLAGLPAKLTGRSRVIELFAGIGTLTFALARQVQVRAIEGDGPAVAALRRGAGGKPIVAELRDIARQPLQAKEIAGAAAVVLDPPFAGAATQMAPLAASGLARVIYVSCNPAALARDARVLQQAGYRVLAATPIDQFLWSPRLESVVVFGK